jgi:pectate lyase
VRSLLTLCFAAALAACSQAPATASDSGAGSCASPAGCAADVDAGSCTRPEGCTDAGPADAGLCANPADCADAGLIDAGSCANPADCTDAGDVDAGSCANPADCTDAGSCANPADCTDAGDVDAGSCANPADCGDAGLVDAGSCTNPLGCSDAGSVDAGGAIDAGAADAGPPGLFPIEGFGRNTRGGWQPGHDEVCVTSLDDSGPGTLREALDTATGPRVIRFCVDGTIALSSALLVPSNLSIDGRGRAVTLTGRGLILVGTDDVIVTHLSIEDVTSTADDGIRIGDPTGGPSERVVIDHVTLEAHGNNGDSSVTDEAVSVIFGSKDITLQWVRVVNWEKFILIGNGDAPQSVDQNCTVSMHHIWTSGTGRRHPQARYGVTDIWNCFFDDWHMYDWLYLPPYRDSFAVQAQDSARIRFENSLVRRNVHPKDALSSANQVTICKTFGTVDTVNVVVTADSTAPLVFGTGCLGSTGWTRPYPVTLDAPDAALRLRLETLTGNQP